MKFRCLAILLTMLLLTGCASDEPENGAMGSQVQTESVQDSEATMTQSTEASESASAQGNEEDAAQTNEAESQEPYIVTFEASTIEGDSFSSDCFADSKLTMINVWATYCNPCLSEMPDLGEIANSYDRADFQMIGIVSDVVEDAEAEEIENAKALIEETNADYPHLLLNQSLYSNLVGGVSSVPTTFFVNQKGEALGYVLGAQSKEAWMEIIEGLLAETN